MPFQRGSTIPAWFVGSWGLATIRRASFTFGFTWSPGGMAAPPFQ